MIRLCVVAPSLVVLLATALSYGQDEDYTYRVLDSDCDSSDEVTLSLYLDFPDGDDVQGYQFGLCHDNDYLAVDDFDITYGEALDSDSFTFEAVITYDDIDNGVGWIAGALLNVLTPFVLTPQEDAELYIVTYDCLDGDAETTDLEFCETLGPFGYNLEVIVDSETLEPGAEDAVINLPKPSFLRGDVDTNGSVLALVDSIFVLEWAFFSDSEAPACMDAADADDSGQVSALVDSLFLLQWAFQSGDVPPTPGPSECGSDGTLDDLECETEADACT